MTDVLLSHDTGLHQGLAQSLSVTLRHLGGMHEIVARDVTRVDQTMAQSVHFETAGGEDNEPPVEIDRLGGLAENDLQVPGLLF